MNCHRHMAGRVYSSAHTNSQEPKTDALIIRLQSDHTQGSQVDVCSLIVFIGNAQQKARHSIYYETEDNEQIQVL